MINWETRSHFQVAFPMSLHSPSPLETDTLSWNSTLKFHTQSRNGVPNASRKTRDTRAKFKPLLIAALVTHMGIWLETQTHGPRSKGQQCLSSQGMRCCPQCLLWDSPEDLKTSYSKQPHFWTQTPHLLTLKVTTKIVSLLPFRIFFLVCQYEECHFTDQTLGPLMGVLLKTTFLYSVVSPRLTNITLKNFLCPPPMSPCCTTGGQTDIRSAPSSTISRWGAWEGRFPVWASSELSSSAGDRKTHTHVEQNPWEHELQSNSRLNNNLNCETAQLSDTPTHGCQEGRAISAKLWLHFSFTDSLSTKMEHHMHKVTYCGIISYNEILETM